MLIKSMEIPLAKMLFVIMLVVYSTMEMATADLPPEDALYTSQASDTLRVDRTPHASRRYLRSTTDVTTTSTDEVRRLVLDISGLKELGSSLEKQTVAFPARLRQSVSTIYSKIMTRLRAQWWLWATKQRDFEEVFKSLQLDKPTKNPFVDPNFPVWKYIVEKTTPKKDVPEVMLNTMVKVLGDVGNLDKFLAQAKSSVKFGDKVDSLYNYQIEKWAQNGDTPEDVFNHLKLDEEKNLKELPSLPEFSMWAAFNTQKKSTNKAFELLKGLHGDRIIDLDLMRALAEIGQADANFEFAQDLLLSQLQYLKKNPIYWESSFKLFKLQGKKTSKPTDLTMDPLGRLWVDFVYMIARGKDGLTNFGVVYDKLFKKVGNVAAVAGMEKVHKDGFFLKSLKENHMKKQEDVAEEMYKPMLNALKGEGNLAKFLAQAKSSPKFGYIVEGVYNYQIEKWVELGDTPEKVFRLLGLNTFEKLEELPSLPEFSMWAAFNTQKKSTNKAFELLKGLHGDRIIDLDLMRALAEIGQADANFKFAQDLLLSQLQYLKKNPIYWESSFKLFKLQGKKTSKPTDLTMDPLGRLWVDFVYMRTKDFDDVYNELFAEVGRVAALKVMKKVHKDGYLLNSLDETKPMKGNKKFGMFIKNPEKYVAKRSKYTSG
ncbi:unnamed protein product [Peronospora effusa]|nr:unnamed protein product [Peronospora effusa]